MLLTLSFLSLPLATLGMGGSEGGARLAWLFLLLAPNPSLVRGRRESSEGCEECCEKGERGGSSKSNVICSGLTSGVSLALPLDAVVAVAAEGFLACACKKGAEGGGPGGMGGGAGAVLMAGGGGGGGAALRFFLENMAVALTSSPYPTQHERRRAARSNVARRVAPPIGTLSFDRQPQGLQFIEQSHNLGETLPWRVVGRSVDPGLFAAHQSNSSCWPCACARALLLLMSR